MRSARGSSSGGPLLSPETPPIHEGIPLAAELTGLKSSLLTVPLCPRCGVNERELRARKYQDAGKYKSYCKTCDVQYNREYRAKHRARIKKYQRELAVTRWQEIKADPKRHLAYLEDMRIYRRLRQDVVRPRTPVFTGDNDYHMVDKEPLVRFIEEKLRSGFNKQSFAKKVGFDSGNITRILNAEQKRVSFYVADQICTAFRRSIYDLYPLD